METITPEELQAKGFAEDMEGLKQFEQPFRNSSLGLSICFLVLGLGVMLKKIPFGLGWFAGLGVLVMLFWLLIRLKRSNPRSRFTGKPLKIYANASPEFSVVQEYIYVCEESKTFFRRVWLVEGNSA